MTTNLQDIASQRRSMMLASLKVNEFGYSKVDKKATEDAQHMNEAAADSGRFTKALLPKAAIDPWIKAKGKVRAEFYRLTLPWGDDGVRVLPVDAFFDLTANVENLKSQALATVTAMADALDHHKAEAQRKLGKMYNEADYPTRDELIRKYDIRLTIMPMPTGSDFRCDLDEATVKELQTAIDARAAEGVNEAMRDLFTRIFEVTDHMAGALTRFDEGAAKRFHDTVVDNVKSLADILPMLNVTKDPRVQQLCDDLSQLTQKEAQTLRDSRETRITTAANARRISERAKAWM